MPVTSDGALLVGGSSTNRFKCRRGSQRDGTYSWIFRMLVGIQSSNMLVSLAAASIGVGELFRSVFAEFLNAGRPRPFVREVQRLNARRLAG